MMESGECRLKFEWNQVTAEASSVLLHPLKLEHTQYSSCCQCV